MFVLGCIGCASIVSKSNWPVTINSSPSGAKVTVSNDRTGAVMHSAETPTTITLPSSSGFFVPARYKLEFSKKGCAPVTTQVTATMNGWYVGNIVIGGLVGWLIVDPATGAMWKLDSRHDAALAPSGTTQMGPVGGTDALRVASIDAVPIHLRTALTRVR
jgi:hypothetical protein